MNGLAPLGTGLQQILTEFQELCRFPPGSLIVIGCSTSEVLGSRIGTASSAEAAAALVPRLLEWRDAHGFSLAVQSCEHLNRCLVMEDADAKAYGLEPVSVVPSLHAGGALAVVAYQAFRHPVMVLDCGGKADGGVDVGDTFIGMHIKRVAVPVRLSVNVLGRAHVTCACSRPMLIGGPRAVYE